MSDLSERLRSLWKRIEPGTDDVVLMTQVSAALAEAAERLDDLQHEHDAIIRLRRPTHGCRVCGALWILNPPDTRTVGYWWSLFSRKCGKCCDNAEMGSQILPLPLLPAHSARGDGPHE